MRKRNRLSLIVIALCLLVMSPINITNMAWDGIIWRTYQAVLCGLSWGFVFISAGIILFACLYEDDKHANK